MAIIESKEVWDLRDLAELARECGEEIEDAETDIEDVKEAKQTLQKLADLAGDLGRSANAEDAEDVADELERAADEYGPALVKEDYFPDYIKEFLSDIGSIPEGLPDWLESNIDWDGVATDLRHEFTCVSFDGEDWYIR